MHARNTFFAQRDAALSERGNMLQRVAIDLSYSHYMTENEAKSLASQVCTKERERQKENERERKRERKGGEVDMACT